MKDTTNLQEKKSIGRDKVTLVWKEVMDIPFHCNEAHVIVILSSKNTDSEQKRQKIQTGEMFSKKRRNAIKRHKQNL